MGSRLTKWIGCALGAISVAGCGSASTMSTEQENKLRHPEINADYKGPSKDDQRKMADSIGAYQNAHKNDPPLKFNNSGG